ncbi:ABC-2 type transport system ATP-binding protein [Streptomyces sp. LamerLS-316]|uniref:ABC transporter ATP-binding protein n=1 Tax=unclassified Streptomyces TaxID=2593676 RepID=UPI000823B346|nr:MULTISPECIES: ABC transporter ATP-binding protein [unclassified Streptomyces]SCK15996.1 ABC-2 type transport system ATP-binding protein [Streptomyces sp. LamerLS-316]
MNAVIETIGLKRSYRGFEAVRGIDFTVARGELFALLGTNGAGKTSTLELLEGQDVPTGGSVRVLGHDPFHDRGKVRHRIGVMLQEGGFPPELTVLETVRMWAGCTTGARPADEALELTALSGRRGVRVKQLSGGERRRLDLALALLGRPEVLFLDEPTTGLDAQSRRDTWDLIRELKAQGTTVLLTTHYLEEAEQLADRLAIMHKGLIATTGRVADVVAERPSRISFELPRDRFLGELPPLAAMGVTRHSDEGGTVRLETRDLQRTATELLSWAHHAGVTLHALDARSASLEEAFMEIAKGFEGSEDFGNTGEHGNTKSTARTENHGNTRSTASTGNHAHTRTNASTGNHAHTKTTASTGNGETR